MKELSLNVLDIVENSTKAKATRVLIHIDEDDELLTLKICDNGCGMREEILRGVIDPFYTTRTTRSVGLGIPLLKMAAEQTGGDIRITSRHESEYPETHGTEVTARFYKKHIDFTPMGDIISTMVTLIQGHPETDFEFRHCYNTLDVLLDTGQMREILGADIPLNDPEILAWIAQYLKDQY